MTDRRRIWITGIGIITAIGTGRDAFRAGLRAGRSPVKRIDRFDPSPFRSQVAAQVDDFDPLAWMPPKTARQLDRFSQFGLVAGRLALDDAGLTPGVDGAAHPQRIGIYLGSALGGIAYAEEQHERYLEKGIRQVAPNLALAVFGGAAPANLGIALDVRGPILSTANSCASGAVALGEAMGDLREGRVDAAIAGGCEIPLSPARVRCVRHHPGAVGRPQRRPGSRRAAVSTGTRRLRHGRGRRVARARGGRDRGGARRHPIRGAARLRRDLRRPPHGPASGRRHGGGPGGDHRPRRRRRRPRRDRLRQRPRLVDADRRRRRGARDRARRSASARRRSRSAAPRRCTAIRSGRRARSRRRSARWRSATAGRRRRSTSSSRIPRSRRLLPGLLREGRDGTYRRVLSTSFGFGGLNAALVFGAVEG